MENMSIYNDIINIASNLISPGKSCVTSKILDEAIEKTLCDNYGARWKENEEVFMSAYENLRNRFKLSSYVDDVPYFYSMYYLPLNVPKIQLVLLQLMRRKKLNQNIRILDVGCSVGTVTIAIIDLIVLINSLSDLYGIERYFQNVSISSIDGSVENIKVYKNNIENFRLGLNKFYETSYINVVEPKVLDITKDWIEDSFDLIIYANILNEIKEEQSIESISNATRNLSEKGDIIIVEPATEEKTKNLNRLRLRIEEEGELINILPCGVSKECKECWNFATANLVSGRTINYIDELYKKFYNTKFEEFENDRLKWSYCVLSKINVKKNCSDLSKVYNNDEILRVNILKTVSKKNKKFKVCDNKGNRAELNFVNCEEYNFIHGENIGLKNVKINNFNDNTVINITETSEVYREVINSSDKNFNFKNIKENNINMVLKRLWGFDNLRDGQFEIIKEALLGNNILGILPTGAGKSICFQLPALLKSGTSIVISPLKSLMKDQIDNLHNIGFQFVDYIDGSKNKKEKERILQRFKKGTLKLLYVTPERMQIREFQLELEKYMCKETIDYFIIDEAHCASEWGHDFRPSYLKIIDVVKMLKYPKIIAVTATASPKVQSDVIDIFNIPKENVIASYSLDRKELSLEVITVEENETKDQLLEEIIKNKIPQTLGKNSIENIHENGSGILFSIYGNPSGTSTKAFGTVHFKNLLNNMGLDAKTYYSQMNENEKIQIQDGFKGNKFPTLVATKGFGMGIDKPNIRYVVHTCYSNSLEAYYQEAGRAGRDKNHASAVIIAKNRVNECVRHTSTVSNYAPPCVRDWKCNYTGGMKCDYGAQARFIEDSFRSEEIVKRDLRDVLYNAILKKYDSFAIDKEKIKIEACNEKNYTSFKDTNKLQQYFYYFKQFGVIKDYYVLKYIPDKKTKQEIFACNKCSNRNCIAIKFGLRLTEQCIDNINNLSFYDEIIEEITEKLLKFKKQKYNMLENMWRYIDNKTICRRSFLMNYFGQDVDYGDGCNFCDIEGIHEFKENEMVKDSESVENGILNTFIELTKNNEFNVKEVASLVAKVLENGMEETIKIRALRGLEDYPDNKNCLYLSSYLSLEQDIESAFYRNQLYDLIKLLYKDREYSNIIETISRFEELSSELIEEVIYKDKKFKVDTVFIQKLVDSNVKDSVKNYMLSAYIEDKVKNKLG